MQMQHVTYFKADEATALVRLMTRSSVDLATIGALSIRIRFPLKAFRKRDL